jgi:hypothetical protein
MAVGGNIPCHAQEPVNANIAIPFSSQILAQKVARLFVHFPTANKPVRKPVKRNGCKNLKTRPISVALKMSRESDSGERKILDILKGLNSLQVALTRYKRP